MYNAILRKRIIHITGVLIILALFAGCREKDILIDSAFPAITATHSPESSDYNYAEDECDPKPEHVGSVKELILSKGEEYQVYKDRSEIETYDLYLQEHYNELQRASSDDLHIGIGFVNEDDIPELFVGWGNNHIAGIHILTFDTATGSTMYLGEFSSFGYCNYNERKNRIRSQYGNQGCFEVFISQIVGDHVELVGACLDDAGQEDEKFYANYPVDKRLCGNRDEIDPEEVSSRPDDKFLVTKQEYNEVFDTYYQWDNDAHDIELHYDNMTPISY